MGDFELELSEGLELSLFEGLLLFEVLGWGSTKIMGVSFFGFCSRKSLTLNVPSVILLTFPPAGRNELSSKLKDQLRKLSWHFSWCPGESERALVMRSYASRLVCCRRFS